MILTILLVILVLAVLGGILYAVGIYNGLVTLQENISQAWSNIDVLLKQRHDEIPKLVKVCEGYMKHERQTLQEVIAARQGALKAKGMGAMASAEAVIQRALGGLFALVENYPELKANQNFLGLQRRVTAIEEQIADRREFYNASVNNYNIRIRQIPDIFVARFLNYEERELFKAAEADRKDVDIEFK